MPDTPDLRISDTDRDQAAAALSAHYAEGRLDDAELDQRLNTVYSARTRSELEAVMADLPNLPASELQVRAELSARRRQLERRMLQQAGRGLVPFGICTVIWAAAGGGAFWPIWVLLLVLIPLMRNGWALHGPSPDEERVEAYLDRKERHRARHADREALRAAHRERAIERARSIEARSGRRAGRRHNP
jgi:hypothetical protein